jgi:hypothetical protein
LVRLAKFPVVLAALVCLGPARALAQDALPAEWLGGQVNERGQRCEHRGEQRNGTQLLLACGPAGVWEVSLSEAPRFVRSFAFPGDVVGFFTEADGRLWVKLHVLEARPLTSGAPSDSKASSAGAVQFPDEGAAQGAPAGPAEAAPKESSEPEKPVAPTEPRVGRVIRSEPGQVVISLGSDDGVARGDRIELSLAGGGAEEEGALSRESLAIGVVTHVTEQSARVRLGIGEAVGVGALATPTKAFATASNTAPPRVGNIWSLETMLRPFAALDELGAGVLLSATLGRRFAREFHLQAVLDPLAFADVESSRSENAVNVALLASYDSQYFEIGLGLGAQTVNTTASDVPPGSGLSVAQLIRLGALDGLNITARSSVVLFHSQFAFGGMVGAMQIPVGRGYWLLLGGGGGDVGYGYGEFGLRALLRGNGHAGSRFLTVTAGGAAVFGDRVCDEFNICNNQIQYGGPMAGIGYEWRF